MVKTFKNLFSLCVVLCLANGLLGSELSQNDILRALHLDNKAIAHKVFDEHDQRALSIIAHQELIDSLQREDAPTIPALYLFSHGLANSYLAARRYARESDLQPFISFNYPDVNITTKGLDAAQTGLAQIHDILRLKTMFREAVPLIKTYKAEYKKLIVFGVSRGAATVASWLGSLEQDDADMIGALVLESPFDSVHTLIDHHVSKIGIGWVPNIHDLSHKLIARAFGKYSRQGTQPIDYIKQSRFKNMPILIICSEQDMLVPWQSSAAVYIELRNQGFNNAHFLYLANGGQHTQMLAGPQGELYKNVLHAFFKKYGLPHNNEMALQGQPHFDGFCQPTIDNLACLIETTKSESKNRIEYYKYLVSAIKRARERRAQVLRDLAQAERA